MGRLSNDAPGMPYTARGKTLAASRQSIVRNGANGLPRVSSMVRGSMTRMPPGASADSTHRRCDLVAGESSRSNEKATSSAVTCRPS
jgi:hypothetical protein